MKSWKYSVVGPNSLWHANGHYSFISWDFLVYGAIDGYSRQIAYLHCPTNNKKETVLKHFEEVIIDYENFSLVNSPRKIHSVNSLSFFLVYMFSKIKILLLNRYANLLSVLFFQ